MSDFKFKVLVVDDNVVCLNIISSLLTGWNYEVFSISRPWEALPIIRTREVHLVLSDLHMPRMNGLELKKQIEVETNLPFILMSADNDEKTMLNCLSSGAMFFIAKPVKAEELKNLWQYVVRSKKEESMQHIEKIKSIQSASLSTAIKKYYTTFVSQRRDTGGDNKKEKTIAPAPALEPIRIKRKYTKRKKDDINNKVGQGKTSVVVKKQKVNWNHALHNLFLQAISHLSLEKAVPKNILDYMNVPGLTRANVASHLQKYRDYLKKISEKGFDPKSKSSMISDRTLRSTFAAGLCEPFSHLKSLTIQPKTTSSTATTLPSSSSSHLLRPPNNSNQISFAPHSTSDSLFSETFPHLNSGNSSSRMISFASSTYEQGSTSQKKQQKNAFVGGSGAGWLINTNNNNNNVNISSTTINTPFIYNQQQGGGQVVEGSTLTNNNNNLPTSQSMNASDFNTSLNDDLDKLNWPEPSYEEILEMQRIFNLVFDDNDENPSSSAEPKNGLE